MLWTSVERGNSIAAGGFGNFATKQAGFESAEDIRLHVGDGECVKSEKTRRDDGRDRDSATGGFREL